MGTENQIDWKEAYDRAFVGMQFTIRREELGLDAETVAEKAGYSITQYTLMEEGKRQITVADYFRVADVWYAYEDADYSAFERKRRKIWRSVKRQFFLYELQIALVIPGAEDFFALLPLRIIVSVILFAGPVVMLLDNFPYQLGLALGWLFREVSNMI
ncbi:helix-turn-helix transcriptional regulator [Daejeonella sp.]|uniref:helix-turn-helix domain-containing protein n=1 Tax=Daejeonella sp. TaxID=2805397 RepID=UPI0030BAE747